VFPLGVAGRYSQRNLSTYRLGDTGRGVLLYCTLTGTITGSHCFPCTHGDTAIIPKSSDIREYQGFLTTVNEPNKRFNYVLKMNLQISAQIVKGNWLARPSTEVAADSAAIIIFHLQTRETLIKETKPKTR
jgi:hypothetical protein